MALRARGPNLTVNQACASGTAAIGLGLRLLRSGEADVVVAGGCEASLTRLVFCGYHSLKATSTRNDAPERASRPFDMERDGFVPAEGAAVIVLESRPVAERRGALILASLAGYGTSCDAYHPTRPDPSAEAPARCMRLALEDAGLAPRDIDCINAHGTSTRLNDLTEGLAITRVFGDRAARIPVTANKSLTGHAIGASGAIEAVFSVLGLRDQVVPPTANLEHPDPDCGLGCIPTRARTARLRAVLSNSFGFGGVNASLVFREAAAGARMSPDIN
jgi:3-oxoacyl-[acyl-carrier-protein] synthase II